MNTDLYHKRFLVVDDMEVMRQVTSSQLRSLGIEHVETASNGAEALRLLLDHSFDMVLCDRSMPVMDGMSLLKAVRDNARLRHLPFVMITSEIPREQIAEAISLGLSDLLIKPYTGARLAERIHRAMHWRPGRQAMAGTPNTTTASAATDPKPTILVVDDVPDNLHLLSQLLKDSYRVRLAHNGEKALAICASDDPPDLVLLDVMMPGMDGFEVARRLRELPQADATPVIFVTAMNDSQARERAMDLGAVDFVTKPIDPLVLKPRIRNFMRFVSLHKRLQTEVDDMLAAARLRDEVEHIVRHDMKAPLVGIIGLTQQLGEDDLLGHRQLAQIRLIEESALQLLNMVALSSELYKMETGRFQLQAVAVDVAQILRRITETSRVSFGAKQLTLSVDADTPVGSPPPMVKGDNALCYALFQNLIHNACEASPAGGRVLIQLSVEENIRITIHNSGVVPTHIRQHFFDKYVSAGKAGGSGLGTYSARLMCEAQNGSIALHCDDALNATTLLVSLPSMTAS